MTQAILQASIKTPMTSVPQQTALRFRTRSILGLVGLLSAIIVGVVYCNNAANRPNAAMHGKQWSAAQLVSLDEISHARWDRMLKKYVDAQGMVNYSGWHRDAVDRKALKQYLNFLSQGDPDTGSQQEKLAFWINAYNALTIQGILQEYPTSSIRNHTGLVGYNLWKDLPLWVGNHQYSLDAIEHQVLRPMGEPRIHFAIVCASIGCPKLRNEAYTANSIETQLTQNAMDFFSNSRHFQFEASSQRVKLSSILNWFGEDFGVNHASQLESIRSFLPPEAQQKMNAQKANVSFLKYDWSLNDQHPVK